MTYIVEGYDKNNDVYELYYTSDNLDDAKHIADVLADLSCLNIIVRNTINDLGERSYERIDLVQVTDGFAGQVVYVGDCNNVK